MRIPPPIIGLACAAATAWAASMDGTFWAGWGLWQWLGIGIMIAGVSLDIFAVAQFRRVRTTINPLRPERSSALVTDGLFAFTRNPMYVGMALALVGWSVALATAWGLIAVAIFVGWITWFQIRPEEAAMRQRFGADFERYAMQTRRWL